MESPLSTTVTRGTPAASPARTTLLQMVRVRSTAWQGEKGRRGDRGEGEEMEMDGAKETTTMDQREQFFCIMYSDAGLLKQGRLQM